MVDPVTTNRSLAQPTRGSDVGTWDVPVNGNMGLLDTIIGGVATIATTGGNTVLNAAQLQCGTITITGALVGNAGIIFPAVQGWWTVQNLTTGNFVVFLEAGANTEFICAPPGEIVDIQVNTNTVRYRNLGRVGSYLDLATSTVPAWIASCAIPPYILCDGSAFNGSTYPVLAGLIGVSVTPDLRGRVRAMMNLGTGRMTVINGDAIRSGGGDQNIQAHTHTGSGTTSGQSADHSHLYLAGPNGVTYAPNAGSSSGFNFTAANTGGVSNDHTHAYSFTTSSTGSGNSQNIQPTTISGITLIRAG
jgi:Phage Tail Collar Domain